MTNAERHNARYIRRKAARDEKYQAAYAATGGFQEIFSWAGLYVAGRKCAKGTRWKCSTQQYENAIVSNTSKLKAQIWRGEYKSPGFHEFDIMERGKLRHIKSVHISERTVQKCLCDNCLMPLYTRSFIYDNCASQPGKGTRFAMDRLKYYMQSYYRRHGNNKGYILVFDMHDFFNSAPHAPIYRENERRLLDWRTRIIANQFMEDFGSGGFGLGSQVSQIYALMTLNSLDHYITEVLGAEGYGRSMDDGWVIHKSREHLQRCFEAIRLKCESDGLQLNERKCRIVAMSDGCTYLKTKFTLTDTGRVTLKMNKKCTKNIRGKLRKFKEWTDKGFFTEKQAQNAYQSYRGHISFGDSYYTLKRMDAFYTALFGATADRRLTL